VAALKTAPKADEEELIELKKQNAELRGQLDEKEKTGSQQGQLNQIAQMLMDSMTAKVVEVKTRPVSDDLKRVKDANGPANLRVGWGVSARIWWKRKSSLQ
jgi:hypothetical protein